MKPVSGVKVTLPALSSVQVPSPDTTKVLSFTSGVLGSKSILLVTNVPSESLSAPNPSSSKITSCTDATPGIFAKSSLSVATGFSAVYSMLIFATILVLPSSSSTVYVISVGLAVKPDSGVNVIAPVVGSILHVPSPGTTKSSPGFVVPTI